MYGLIQKLLNEEYDVHETVLIESPFSEKTRRGKFRRTVVLGITPVNLIIASGCNGKSKGVSKGGFKFRILELCSMYPLRLIDLTVFQRTRKQSIKVTYSDKVARYFELGQMDKRKVFWKLWCLYLNELRRGETIWPYYNFKPESPKYRRARWTDKYLYLGPQRHQEDQIRPTPIPGLGPSEEIKLSYLKPQYFGCWDQSEHWVQCDEAVEPACDYDIFTYTGVPTSNVTYTPLTTTRKEQEGT